MAAMTMPSVGGDDLYLYMHEIIEEEFPTALRQAFKTLWDKQYALTYGPFDSAHHHFRALDPNTFRWLFPNQGFPAFQLASNPVSSISFEDLDFDKLQDIVVRLGHSSYPRDFFSRRSPYRPFHRAWEFISAVERTPNVDGNLFVSAVDQLMAIRAEHVNSKGIMNPQLLKLQLAQAREVFMDFGVTLNDSRNAIDFSAAGLQDLIFGSGFQAPEPQFPYFETLERRDRNIWIKGKYLGGGNFGKVFRLTHRESGMKVAIKEVKMEPQYSKMPEEVKQLQNEIDKLSRLRHPRIVRFHGSEQKGDVMYLFLDFMAGGSLHDFIRQREKLDEQLTRKFTQQILEGVDYLHSNEITHRDIKGPNILLDSDRSVKLADFGVSRTIEKIGTKTDLTSYVGTTYWMAPEILWGEGYGRKVDIWSVGCTVVEMLTGNPPLRNLEPRAAMFRIGSKPLEVKLPESTEEAKDFVRAALTWNPTERPNCEELLTHPFAKRNIQERDGGRESPRLTPESDLSSEAAVVGSAVAAPLQEPTEEDMKKKSIAIIEEYLIIKDMSDVAVCLKEVQSPSVHYVFVDEILTHTMEKKASDRNASGRLLHFLLRDGVLTAQQYLQGLEQFLEYAEDIEIDIPQLWNYLGELLGPTVFDGNIDLNELFKCILKYVSKHKAAKLFAYMLQTAIIDTSREDLWAILNRYDVSLYAFFEKEAEAKQFAKDENIEFAVGQGEPSLNTGSSNQHSARIQEELRTLILKRKARNDEVFNWIDRNVSSEDAKAPPFIRALVTVVCEGAMEREDGGVCKCNINILKERKPLLQKYINDNASLEIHAVYAVQALFVQLDHPPSFVKSYFDSLYDEEIITEDSFKAWENSSDEEPGKGVTVTAASEFFRWLKSAPEETGEES